ncbi:MAG: SAM-dependent methyltransferase [Candidatus Symbiobacter sp.]|nr:SAM-dependent methyltransferase [Candidatus Symbiobacter sp.]
MDDTHSVEKLLHQKLASGPIPVAEYMRLVLGHPRLGYYATRTPFGREGDFITAPEICQAFGELIGLWAAHVWGLMGAPEEINLVELGPGRGTLMADALRACGKVAPSFLAAASIHFIETSPALRDQQKRAMGDHPALWYEKFSQIPKGPLIVIGNEFMDALPVHQLVRTGSGWCERQIARSPDGDLFFTVANKPSPLSTQLHPLVAEAALGSVAEISPKACAVTGAIANRLRIEGGAALLIDYGYAESAAGDTLQAVKHHRRHEVLAEPGTADLTAHVDFAALCRAANNCGVKIFGPVTQGVFLERLGIMERSKSLLRDADLIGRLEIETQIERLTSPTEMGNLFKVLGLASNNLSVLPGFVP